VSYSCAIQWKNLTLSSLSDNALVEHIGAFVRHLRIEQNKTQEQLSSGAGISRSTLSPMERGETVATLIQVLRVLDQLEVLSVFEVKEILSPLAL
jgi:transcriptional regulator with XRE-family HTH domain